MRSAIGPRARAAAAAVVLAAGLAAPVVVPAVSAGAAAHAPAAARVPRYNHIVVIMFTEHGFVNIAHDPHAPTFNRLARQYGLATRYYTTADPDAAGVMAFLAGNSFGIDDHLPYWDQQIRKPSLLSQLSRAHKSWREYVQDIPYAGYLGNCYPTVCQESDTLYNQAKFNPVPDLASVAGNPAQARKMVPASELAADARAGRLPDFSLINASECANMHGGPPWCQDSPANLGQPNDEKLIAAGDAYLRQVTGEIMSGPQWRHGNNAIIITATEGVTSAGCCDAKPGTGRVFTVIVTSHGPRHLTDGRAFNTYSLLATVEHAFGLGCLQFSCDTRHVLPMARLFGAPADGRETFGRANPAPRLAAVRPVPPRPAAAGRGPSAPSPWVQVPSPNTGPNDNDLWSVSGRSAADIWAVGSLLPSAKATIVRTLAEHYNGTTWSIVRTPKTGPEASYLFGVATLPDGTAWATGTYTQASGHTGRALTEHWNGHRWTIVPAANPGAAEDMLYSATAASRGQVWAVGTYGDAAGYFHPLIEGWTGRRWTVRPLRGLRRGARGILTSVTSGATGVWATGQLSGAGTDREVVLHLRRGTWRVVSERPVLTAGDTAADAYPQAVALGADGRLWVAGRYRSGHSGYRTFAAAAAAHSGLVLLRTPDPTRQDNYLWGVAAVRGGASAWAVGDSVPPSTANASSLIEFGSAAGGWVTVPSPNPGAANGNTILDGVFAVSDSNVWAVGTYDGAGGMRTLILHYTGGPV
jgi:hypothetical protein